jgi:hypothetical protein
LHSRLIDGVALISKWGRKSRSLDVIEHDFSFHFIFGGMAATHYPFPPVRPVTSINASPTRRLRNLTSIHGKALCSTMTFLCTSCNIPVLYARLSPPSGFYVFDGLLETRVRAGMAGSVLGYPTFANCRGVIDRSTSLGPPILNPSLVNHSHARHVLRFLTPPKAALKLERFGFWLPPIAPSTGENVLILNGSWGSERMDPIVVNVSSCS